MNDMPTLTTVPTLVMVDLPRWDMVLRHLFSILKIGFFCKIESSWSMAQETIVWKGGIAR